MILYTVTCVTHNNQDEMQKSVYKCFQVLRSLTSLTRQFEMDSYGTWTRQI